MSVRDLMDRNYPFIYSDELATKEVAIIEPEADVGEAARLMRERNVGALPVVRNEKLVGMITERDFFKLIA